MLVLSMNPKRQRRPNVRLGEIGDVSAAFACGFSRGDKERLGHKRWKSDFGNLDPIFGFSELKSSEFTVSDPGVSSQGLADLQQNRENKNPNSSKANEFTSSDEIDMTKSTLNFSNVTRKSRVMKRRRPSRSRNNSVIGSAWGSKLSPEFSRQEGKECDGKECGDPGGCTCNIFDDFYHGNGFKYSSDREIPATSKEAYEYHIYDPNYDVQRQGNYDVYWNEGAFCEENGATKRGSTSDEMKSEEGDVNGVRTWLEDLGFGKYADVFEMHEVDEEALLLLTLEDLKEMGVFAVGSRRKLYNAIQQLKDGDVSA